MGSRPVGPTLEVASAGRQSFQRGDLAQLGERFHGMEEVTGSNPVISTNLLIFRFWVASLVTSLVREPGGYFSGFENSSAERLESRISPRSKPVPICLWSGTLRFKGTPSLIKIM